MIPVLALMLLVSAGCVGSAPTAGALQHDRAERHTLAPGEAAVVAGGRLQIRFDEVVSDSRCPTGEQCVWAGRAEVAVTMTADGTSASYRLYAPGAVPNVVVHGSHALELVDLAPHPTAGRETAKGEYRATFEVRPE